MLGAKPMPHPDTSHRLQLRGCPPHPAGVMSDPGLPAFFEQSQIRQILVKIISRNNSIRQPAIPRHDEHWNGGGGGVGLTWSFMSIYGSTRNEGEMKPGH